MNAGAAIWRQLNPDLALKFQSKDSLALAMRSDILLAEGPNLRASSNRIERDAKAALISDPLNARALRQIGLTQGLTGQSASVRRLMVVAEKVSRRDVGTQMWWIEDSASRGDVTGALAHYDLALSSSKEAGPILYPILTNALEDPQIRESLAKYVRSNVIWLHGFLQYGIATSKNPKSLVELILRAGKLPKGDDFRVLERELLWKLAAAGQNLEARDFFLTLSGANIQILGDARMTPETTDRRFGPLAWTLSDTPDVNAVLDSDGRLWIRVSAGIRALAAQRTLFLSQGQNSLSSTTESSPDVPQAGVTWEVLCLRKGGSDRIGKFEVSTGGGNKYNINTVNVPAGCPAQLVQVFVAGKDATESSEVGISKIAIKAPLLH